MFLSLLKSRRFAPLFWCQFLSGFNDNFVRNMLAMLVLFELGKAQAGALITLAVAVFVLPSILLSGLGGEIADSHDKAMVARRLKLAEIFIQMIAAAGIWLPSLPLLYAALFGLGVISALFNPIKYGLLPEHLARHELVAGNALVDAATFLAILLGLIFGGIAAGQVRTPVEVTAQLMGIAFASYATSLAIPATKIAAPDLRAGANLWGSTCDSLREIWRAPFLKSATQAVSWFWLTGAVALALIPVAIRKTTNGGLDVEVAITALFAVGMAIGSLGAAIFARGRIVLGLAPLGALGMAGFLVDLALAHAGSMTPSAPAGRDIGLQEFFSYAQGLHIAADVIGVAAAGGLFIVPISAALQVYAPRERLARTLAGVNILSSIYIVAGSLGAALLQSLAGASEPVLLAVLGAANVGAAWYAFAKVRAPGAETAVG
jgi:acyl-[acyl-carrier-protein]-phospholipid O-acyltransferase/long-chain-fatty-acid--[acyl-carrier-protein] ligase